MVTDAAVAGDSVYGDVGATRRSTSGTGSRGSDRIGRQTDLGRSLPTLSTLLSLDFVGEPTARAQADVWVTRGVV